MDAEEKKKKTEALAERVWAFSKNTLLTELRFLDIPLSRLTPVPVGWNLAADGVFLYYDAKTLLTAFRQEEERVIRDHLHVVMHCIFRHGFADASVQRELWDLACDIAAESMIFSLGLSSARAEREKAQLPVIRKLKKTLGRLTAEKVYRYYRDRRLSAEEAAELRKLFYADDHTVWYLSEEEKEKQTGILQKRGAKTALKADWKEVSQRMQTDLETFSRAYGTKAGELMQELEAVNREKCDYAAFLRKFAVKGEAVQVNQEEFDYIFYSYGMKLFRDTPLVEPLEYQEVRKIREFVIAVDTSGSVSGELVQKFIQKTYDILMQEESYFKKINVHIIQCDAKVQEDVKITSRRELSEYLAFMKLRGFGGTDFRPVFSYVEELSKKGEWKNLSGLLYFTDGFGTYPKKKPPYRTAFVFLREDYEVLDVPPWAIRVVLDAEDITGGTEA